MNTLIIYATTHGTTGKVAGLIWEHLDKKKTHCAHVDLVQAAELYAYDTIVLGASVHYGQIQREMLVFCEQNYDILTHKRIALYLCGMLDGKAAEEEMKQAFPEVLVEKAICYMMMGGEYLVDKMGFVDKLKLKFFSGYMRAESVINYDNIQHFVAKLEAKKIVNV